MATIRYFAYGSNMLTLRLSDRVPSARAIGVAVLADHRLDFAKASIDGSGKADVVQALGSDAYGVLFEMDDSELGALDGFEGRDYERTSVQVRIKDINVDAISYVAKANKRDPSLKPYCWYLALVRAGAIQHGLHTKQLDALRLAESSVDPRLDRETRLAALAALDASGYVYLLEELAGEQLGVNTND